jgi:mRNA interferase RelE/StbE
VNEIRLSRRAERDLDRLDRATQKRILRRLEQLAGNPSDIHLSAPLTNAGDLRKSRVGGWRIIFRVVDEVIFVVMIERRDQVYQRI